MELKIYKEKGIIEYEYTNTLTDINDKLMMIGRLEEIKQDVLNTLYDR